MVRASGTRGFLNMYNFYNNQGGISILGIIILSIILILVLSYFGFDLRSLIESPKVQENFDYVGGVANNVWNKFLKKPTLYIWNNIIVKTFESLKKNDSLKLEELSPKLSPI
ncbi:MAG: hypothetical protein QG644_180 [Patescibacteria group bacterium]|nr:hypothetical protein [Patescibacteria group bacterium]